jgi:uncharacterized protein RhaS with RHS repeats
MYSPIIGRFLQRDPAGYVDGFNMYSYVMNSPTNFVDPMGLMARGSGFLKFSQKTGTFENGRTWTIEVGPLEFRDENGDSGSGHDHEWSSNNPNYKDSPGGSPSGNSSEIPYYDPENGVTEGFFRTKEEYVEYQQEKKREKKRRKWKHKVETQGKALFNKYYPRYVAQKKINERFEQMRNDLENFAKQAERERREEEFGTTNETPTVIKNAATGGVGLVGVGIYEAILCTPREKSN